MNKVALKVREARITKLYQQINKEKDAITRDFDIPKAKSQLGKCYK